MRKANYNDKDTVVNILTTSFMNDPHVNWLIEESRNKNKLKILIEYVFGESLNRGEIYLSDDNKAAVLWNTEKKEKFSFEFIIRNFRFLFQVGLKSTKRALKTDKIIYNFYPKKQPYCQLYLIGVLPEEQGKGLASSLMNPMIENMKTRAIPIHLETANLRNVEIYKKKGFSVINTMQFGKNSLYWMRR
jgi:ribosomal protein S18 acetylase RimI-like enzyme